jgi:hypothetical protein
MSRNEVERFVGLLISDEEFVRDLAEDWSRTLEKRSLRLDKEESVILREGFETYVRPEQVEAIVSGGATVAAPIAVAVAAAVVGSVAGAVASKVVDKVMGSDLINPMNDRIRDSILYRELLDEKQITVAGERFRRQGT